ncbi:MAG: M28 family peptidase [Armatimonadetes bacterium]|nr:M28 family peptidase [Armatimonadota bacterium]
MSLTDWKDADLEARFLGGLSIEAPWALVETFSTLTRESGSEDERKAARYISDRLTEWGVPHQVFEPELYLSLPRTASLDLLKPTKQKMKARPPAFSASTGKNGVRGQAVYVPTGFAARADEIFRADVSGEVDLHGKIALMEGFPKRVLAAQQRGAIGCIFISPGQNIHEGICTQFWGTPDLDSIKDKPGIPVVCINKTNGEALIKACREGPVTARIRTEMEEGWKRCPLVVAEIRGAEVPEEFVLVHGHLDSWYVGVGDNAVGDATLLELARVFWQNRSRVRRTLRVAWWPAHSTGRYAGSTWYADRHAVDLAENCVAQVNIDSPGCRWATEYDGVMWMKEAEAFCQRAIADATGKKATGARPLRAGDYSFNNLGLTGFFMLLSTMPEELRVSKGYHHVGGCGGNIAWHTPDDTLEIAEKDNLMRDLKVYTVALVRTLDAPVHPFDFTAVADEFRGTLTRCQEQGAGRFDLTPGLQAAAALRESLEDFYRRAEEWRTLPAGDPRVRRANAVQRRLARLLIPVNFVRTNRFRHEQSVSTPPLPDLAPIASLPHLDPASDGFRLTVAHLIRGQNRVVYALRRAREACESAR